VKVKVGVTVIVEVVKVKVGVAVIVEVVKVKVDCWLLHVQRQIFHSYSEREQVQQYLKLK
jgi:hypothetical protein